MINEEFDELYSMLSLDRDEVKTIKDESKRDLSILMGRIKDYKPINLDISNEYDLDNNFDRFKIDDSSIRQNLRNDIVDYKILLMQDYLNNLFEEKKFNDFIKEKEESMSKPEYMEYIKNPVSREDRINSWYQEFIQQ